VPFQGRYSLATSLDLVVCPKAFDQALSTAGESIEFSGMFHRTVSEAAMHFVSVRLRMMAAVTIFLAAARAIVYGPERC
jgi:hypothetical protein